MTANGGAGGYGTVFKIDASGNLTTLDSFDKIDGANPFSTLIQDHDGNFYGTTEVGGPDCGYFGCGTVFRMDSTGSLTTLHSFTGTDGSNCNAGLVQGSDGNFYGTTTYGGTENSGTVYKIDPSGNLTTLESFANPEGAYPNGGLVQGSDGSFYGTAAGGRPDCPFHGCGTIFKIDSAGNLTTLHSFNYSPDGSNPVASLARGTDRNFYGTTLYGGVGSQGTVFKIDQTGDLTVLYSLGTQITDGTLCYGTLVQGSDGDFYGTTSAGGPPGPFGYEGDGTLFKIDGSGNLTILHSFSADLGEGILPTAGLVQGTDGSFYGTTSEGGAANLGTIFKLDATQNLTTLHSFMGTDGAYPSSELVQGSDGNFYGTTFGSGRSGRLGWGTVFKIDASGNLTTLHSFADSIDGARPSGALVQGGDGEFYGVAFGGGANSLGTIFKIDTTGFLTTLYSFVGADGASPVGRLLQTNDGSFFGTTMNGGAGGVGVVFRFVPASTTAPCTPDSSTLCLNNGRFQVRATWMDFQGNTGLGNIVPNVSSNDSGVMWFFGPDNWELLIKVLNGCGVNGHYWVFGAAATNVEYSIQVTDTQTGDVRTYTNPLGTTSPAITDTSAFPGCP